MINIIEMVYKEIACPVCKKASRRHSIRTRKVNDLGEGEPLVHQFRFSVHYCEHCEKHFSMTTEPLAKHNSLYTERVKATALELTDEGFSREQVARIMAQNFYVKIPRATLQDWHTRRMREGQNGNNGVNPVRGSGQTAGEGKGEDSQAKAGGEDEVLHAEQNREI